jgi:hypothetical protein
VKVAGGFASGGRPIRLQGLHKRHKQWSVRGCRRKVTGFEAAFARLTGRCKDACYKLLQMTPDTTSETVKKPSLDCADLLEINLDTFQMWLRGVSGWFRQ